MSLLSVDESELQELARQAILQEYRLPYGETDGMPVDRLAYATPPELLNLVKLAVRVGGMDAGVINIITADQQHQIAAVGVDPAVCSRDDSMCSKVFTSGSITSLADASRDPRFADNPFVNGGIATVRSYASVPLVTHEGYALGTLCVFSPEVSELDVEQREGLEILARQVMEVLGLQFKTRQLVEALEVVRRSNEDLAGFAARVSHDLKNPLTAILGYTELGELDDAVVAVQDAQLQVDQAQVTALLQNLVSNAIKYSTPGAPPRIEVVASVGETQVLRVTDHGKGIAPADRQRVLEPLVRLHRDGEPAGNGIGLATCVRIAAAHDGSISVTETPGGGTTVAVDLGPAA